MKKKYYFFIAVIFFINPGISCEKYQEKEYYRPSLGSACYQMATGFALHFASGYGLNYFHENNNAVGEQISGFGKGLACQLMADGFFEFLHWSYHSTLNEFYWLKTPQDKEIGLTSFLTSEVEDFRPQALQLQHEVSWNKGVTITRALTSIPFSISFVAQSFMNRSVLQYNSVFEHELFVCGGIFSTGYYLSELYSVYNQKGLRQGDIPSMGALAGWFKMVSAPQAFALFPLRSHWGNSTHFYLSFLGCAQVYSALFQTLKNARNRIKGKATVSITPRPMTPLTHKPTQVLPTPTALKKPQTLKEFLDQREANKKKLSKTTKGSIVRRTLQPINNENTAIPEAIETLFSQDTYQPPKPKEKIKTRGKSNPPKNAEVLPQKSNLETINRVASNDSREKSLRKDILHDINELMKCNAVKEKKINPLLSDTCLFLHGAIEKVDGSEFAIVFDRGNNRISIKYETPHPANIYEGFKLKRVLNSMETALMYNWDEESIRQYMKDHDINRFYRIPKDLLSVLWTRPDI